MRTVQMELLRPDELVKERKRISLVYQPIGPMEWHSYHLPMGTDALIAQEYARRCAARTGGVVGPTLFVGTETLSTAEGLARLGLPEAARKNVVGMDFHPNTVPSLYYREEVFAVTVREQLRLLAKMGYRMIAVVNAHGAHGQTSTLRRLCAELSCELGVRCVCTPFGGPRLDAIVEKEKLDPGHADKVEASLMMAVTDSVALQNLPPIGTTLFSGDFGIAGGSQFTGRAPADGVVTSDPREATAALGESLFEAGTDDMVAFVLDQYRQLAETN